MQTARYQPVGKAPEEAKAVRYCSFWYLLEQCSSTISKISSRAVRMRSALGVENFHTATQTKSISRRISQILRRSM